VVQFQGPSPNYTVILRLGYLWFSSLPGYVSLSYPGGTQQVAIKRGLHSAYAHITGSISQVTVRTVGGGAVCIGDAEAGNLRPDLAGPVVPATSSQ